jgi:predicted nuclease of restriction endonuclease-like (RecB) superfamily
VSVPVPVQDQRNSFVEVLELIEAARGRAFQAVNTVMIELYWRIGQTISRKLAAAEWGDGVVDELARHVAQTYPGLRGFTRRNLYRMRQFHEAYPAEDFVSALLTQLPWTHHLIILGQARMAEEREFYLRRAIAEGWTSRDLERQFRLGTFDRAVTRPPFVSAALAQTQPRASEVFRDAHMVEFLNLPPEHGEADLHLGLLRQLRDFMIELGRDFCFVGSQYPLQVGGRDFALEPGRGGRGGVVSFPRYEAYGDSGVEWLGEVPSPWNVRPIKHLVTLKSGGTPSKENPAYWNGDIPWGSAKDLKSDKLEDTVDHITRSASRSSPSRTRRCSWDHIRRHMETDTIAESISIVLSLNRRRPRSSSPRDCLPSRGVSLSQWRRKNRRSRRGLVGRGRWHNSISPWR